MRFLPLVVMLAFAAPVVAQEAPTVDKSQKKICRTLPATGSIMGKRECHTKAEWDAMNARSRADRDRWDRESQSTNGRLGVDRSN